MNIKRTLKRLIDDTQYVAALEKQNDLLKENLQQEKDNLQKQKEDFRKEKEQNTARRRSMTSKSSTSMPSTPSPSKCRRLASLCAITS